MKDLPNKCNVRWIPTIILFAIAVVVYALLGGMGYHYEPPRRSQANEQPLADIAAIQDQEPAKADRLTAGQMFLIVATALLLAAAVGLMAYWGVL